ncbi:MAG TPA: hypothetical protein VF059_02955 [Casimicrobiaceae bacterium]
MRTTTLQVLETIKESSRKFGPYVLLELLLPGGTLFALALFLYRRQSSLAADVARARSAVLGTWTKLRALMASLRWRIDLHACEGYRAHRTLSSRSPRRLVLPACDRALASRCARGVVPALPCHRAMC